MTTLAKDLNGINLFAHRYFYENSKNNNIKTVKEMIHSLLENATLDSIKDMAHHLDLDIDNNKSVKPKGLSTESNTWLLKIRYHQQEQSFIASFILNNKLNRLITLDHQYYTDKPYTPVEKRYNQLRQELDQILNHQSTHLPQTTELLLDETLETLAIIDNWDN